MPTYAKGSFQSNIALELLRLFQVDTKAGAWYLTHRCKHCSALVHPNNCSTKTICLGKQEPQEEDTCFHPHMLEEA